MLFFPSQNDKKKKNSDRSVHSKKQTHVTANQHIFKSGFITYINFQVTISKWCIVNASKFLKPTDLWNSLELSSWIFKRIFLSSSFFYKLSFDFAFSTGVSWYRWREDLSWSYNEKFWNWKTMRCVQC